MTGANPSPVGRTKDAGWQIGVSRTVAAPAAKVWELLASERGQAIWLGAGASLSTTAGEPYETADGTVGEVRSFRPLDRMRLTWRPTGWDHETIVQVAIRGDGDKTMIRFHQDHLANADERERQRAHWASVIDRVTAELT